MQPEINTRTVKIPYKFYKNSSKTIKELICWLFNICIQKGTTPLKWIRSELILLPKPKDWEENLQLTQSIILLETLQKVYTKLLTNRLTFAIQTFQLLSPLNWAGLLGEWTFFLIQMFHNLIEHAKLFKQQLWIILQDISKFFDSIEPYFLTKTLERIHIPPNIISSIMTLAENRRTRANTEYGLAETSYLQRGIDQRDSISPILWCIYYDVILTKVSKTTTGFEMTQIFNRDLRSPYQQSEISINVPAMVYMNDTIWLINSKQKMEMILQLVHSFAEMIGIKINTDKTDLLIINPPSKSQQFLNFGNQTIVTLKNPKPIRYLGV